MLEAKIAEILCEKCAYKVECEFFKKKGGCNSADDTIAKILALVTEREAAMVEALRLAKTEQLSACPECGHSAHAGECKEGWDEGNGVIVTCGCKPPAEQEQKHCTRPTPCPDWGTNMCEGCQYKQPTPEMPS